jgi:hypothetical protein
MCGGNKVLRHAREQETRVASARGLGHAARFEHDDLRASRCEEVRGRDARDASADDRDVRRYITSERWIGARNPVEPETCGRRPFHLCVSLTPGYSSLAWVTRRLI